MNTPAFCHLPEPEQGQCLTALPAQLLPSNLLMEVALNSASIRLNGSHHVGGESAFLGYFIDEFERPAGPVDSNPPLISTSETQGLGGQRKSCLQ